MEQQEAIDFIGKAIPQRASPQLWADLGCGSGTFTGVLAHLLPKGSHIYAIDRMEQYLPRSIGDTVSVSFVKADFEEANFSFSKLDGILMANALHYIKNKQLLIERLEKYLSADKKFIVVEYDIEIANRWVPYPIGFTNLKELFTALGYSKISKVGERRSIFEKGNLYAAAIEINI